MKSNVRTRLVVSAVALGAMGLWAGPVLAGMAEPQYRGEGFHWVPSDPSNTGAMKSEAAGKVNLNMASAAELARVPGIGPERAEAIVNYRYANGLFVSVDELLNVKGIGQKELGAFRNLVTVE